MNVLDDSVVEETDRTTMGRAWIMWGGGTRDFDFNPHTGGWPAFSFYFALACQMAFKAWWSVSHPGGNAEDFADFFTTHVDHAFLLTRIAGVLMGAASVYLTFRLGARLAGREAGLLGGALLALCPLHIQTSQHVADPNLLALLFVLLAALAMAPPSRLGAGRHDRRGNDRTRGSVQVRALDPRDPARGRPRAWLLAEPCVRDGAGRGGGCSLRRDPLHVPRLEDDAPRHRHSAQCAF